MTRRAKTLRRSGRGTLLILAVLLLGSGLVRLGGGTGEALAREFSALTSEAAATPPPESCITGDGLEELLASIQSREKALAEAEAALAERSQSLAVAEEEIRANLDALAQAEESLSATLALADGASERDLERLTSVYENMKAREASALFEKMDPEFAAGFLGRMRPDAAAAIFAGLSPEAAYTISVVLAGRNATAPQE